MFERYEGMDLASPQLNLAYDMKNTVLFKKNDQNFIYALTKTQLPVLKDLALLDIYLSQGNIVEPHWHPNSAELVYVVKGEIVISVLNPNTKELLSYRLKAAQTVYIPMGWFHWQVAMEDNTQFLAVFDNSLPETVLESDVLLKTPKDVLQLAYGINGEELEQVLAPLTESVLIGPPVPQRTEQLEYLEQRAQDHYQPNYASAAGSHQQWRIGNYQP
ncbi:cupin domain-containing protein [Paenibacillus swuensis]|uniref:cupin domain-containing protein n=1 Tax=Paenibacillus swuensis TaxID=1178515 RepID=UPI000837C227|nr:cupin domain-containing protein [Paenibacillus swuensis]